MALLLHISIPDDLERCDISVLYVTGEATTQTLRVAARNAAISPSEMRTERPRRCTGRAPESMSRRTVRSDTFKSSAVSLMVRSLVTGRTRMVEVISTAPFEAGRCAGLKVRSVVPAPSSALCLFPAPAATFRSLERRRDTRRPSRLHARSSIGPRFLDDAGGRACGADSDYGDGLPVARAGAQGGALWPCVEGQPPRSPRAGWEAFVTAVKPPLSSMSADRGVCAPNLLY